MKSKLFWGCLIHDACRLISPVVFNTKLFLQLKWDSFLSSVLLDKICKIPPRTGLTISRPSRITFSPFQLHVYWDVFCHDTIVINAFEISMETNLYVISSHRIGVFQVKPFTIHCLELGVNLFAEMFSHRFSLISIQD